MYTYIYIGKTWCSVDFPSNPLKQFPSSVAVVSFTAPGATDNGAEEGALPQHV